MDKPETWEKQREWLEEHVGQVKIQWFGPERFFTTVDANIYNGVATGQIHAQGITGEQSVRNVFSRVTNLSPSEHLVLCQPEGDVHVTVDKGTLKLTPWQPPVANAA